ncbi:MAG: hypothetical protein ACLFPQ_02745 [Candidatus Woesearchaeota archaeon]
MRYSRSKKAGLAEIWIFVGVVVIMLVIFLAAFVVQKIKTVQADINVDSKLDRIDKELFLLNYLRSRFKDDMNYADYIAMSNFYLIGKNIRGVENPSYERPEYYDEFIRKTVDYFDESLSYGQKSWYIKVTAVRGRDISLAILSGTAADIRIDDDSNIVYISPFDENDLRKAKRRSSGILASQIIPSPHEKTFIIQLYGVDMASE